ncbi:MAG: tyrosine-type recombinase/integrase [Polyangiaceae bacterium]
MAKPIKHRGKWRIRWFDSNGVRRSEVYDDFAAARSAQRDHETEVDRIKLGLRSPEPLEKTFNDLCDLWIEKRVPKKRDGRNDKSIIKGLREHFGPMSLRTIDVADADDYAESRDDIEPKTIANHLTLVIAMMNYAVELNPPWLVRVPPFKKPKVIALGRNYRYLRNDEEIGRLLRAARLEGEHVFVLYATAVYTGMRAGELAGLEWADVAFDRRLIMVQRSFEGLTKSGHARPVPILDALLPILREWKMRNPGRLVFTNRDGGMLGKSARPFQEVLHRVLARAGFPSEAKPNGRERRYITFHGFRHTFASLWMMKCGELFKLQKILGHQSIAMTERYAHLAPRAFVDDYGRFGPALSMEAEIVALPHRAG